jgi:hypothetical protein
MCPHEPCVTKWSVDMRTFTVSFALFVYTQYRILSSILKRENVDVNQKEKVEIKRRCWKIRTLYVSSRKRFNLCEQHVQTAVLWLCCLGLVTRGISFILLLRRLHIDVETVLWVVRKYRRETREMEVAVKGFRRHAFSFIVWLTDWLVIKLVSRWCG